MQRGTVYFIGAGPGDPELITVKGRDIVREADLVLYAGSLVPRAVVREAPARARVEDSSGMTLEETHGLLRATVGGGGVAARVHTGDPSLYGAVREQMALLARDGIPFEVVPGVTAAFAAAASAGISFTLPERTQSLILTRIGGRTPVPEPEDLRSLAAHGSAMGVYLSASRAREVQEKLLAGGYPEETAVLLAHRVGWPDERLVFARLGELARVAQEEGMQRQAVFLVLPGQEEQGPFSRLYSRDFGHGYREAKP
jgi:precorrin-4/cobalt-precorrin-4 C11-methyltransferase